MNNIDIEHLTLTYQHKKDKFTVLNDVSLTVPSGTVCAVIGPSGCGKSTLLQTVAGLNSNYQGKVFVGGAKVNPKNVKIGFMPQNYGLLPWKNIKDNILLGTKIKGITVPAEVLNDILIQLGLEGLENRYPHELSGGQQQRVGLARAFILQPDILLMDEPFSALDAITREEMQDVFLSLWHKYKVTTILITHYVEEALYLGQKIAVMTPGKIARIIDNNLFGDSKLKESAEFFQMGLELRNALRQKEA